MTCYVYVSKLKIPNLCLENGFKYPAIPDCISKLNRIEERLVSTRHVFQSIWTVAGAHGKFRRKGAITNIPVNVDTTVTQLPRKPSDTNIIAVKLARRMNHNKHYMQGNVNVNNALEAALFLSNTKTYKKHNISVDNTWLEATINELEQMNISSDEDEPAVDNPLEGDEEITKDNIPVGANETLFTGDIDGIRMAPEEGSVSLSVLSDEDSESLSFPKIFVGRQMEPKNNGKPISYNSIVKSFTRHYGRRAVRPDFLLNMVTKRLLKTLVSKVSVMLRKSKPGVASINTSTALNNETIEGFINKDEVFNVFSTIRSSPAYWKTEKSNVMAMIRPLGIPTFFTTLSAAETKWPELLVILKKLVEKIDITEEEATNLPPADIMRLIQSDAPTCSRYFDTRFRQLKSAWKPPHGSFGN